MLKKFYPYEYAESVFDLDYDKLYELGYRGIIFDIDNTLVHHGADSTPEVDRLFREIHSKKLKTVILSNNSKERIERFLKNIDSPYIHEANKPAPEGFYNALKLLGTEKEHTVVIGDQLFTDIFGANRCGIPNILVKFLRREGETKIGKKRTVEKVVLKFYGFNKVAQNRIGDIYRTGV